MSVPNAKMEGATRKCSSCGFVNREDVNFCTSCGTSLTSTATSYCPNCGKVVSAGIAFCGYCGKQLQDAAPRQQQEAHAYSKPTKFCQHCGGQIDAEAEICPKCGVRVSQVQAQHGMAAQYAAQSATAPPDIDKAALRKIKIFAILGMVGIVLAVVVPLLTGISIIDLLELGINSGIGYGVLSVFLASMASIMFGLVIGIVAIVEARSVFVILSRFDHGFSAPASFARAFYVGMTMFLINVILIMSLVASAGSASLVLIGALVVLLALDVAGAISIIIGGIGVILGIWRIGVRYDETIIKVASILYIIPFADVIAPILVYIGASGAGKKLSEPGGY